MMRSGNPALQGDVFTSAQSSSGEGAMTIQGTTNKALILLFLTVLSAGWTWSHTATAMMWVFPAAIAGFVIALVTIFKKEWAAVTAPLYALAEGVVLGGLSLYYEASFPGIVQQAVALTFGTLFCLLMAYKSGLIKPTENFKLGVFAATGGIAVLYLVDMVMHFFGARIPFIYQSGPIGIGFSVIVVIVAALNLVMDFDFIENGVDSGAPQYMEWYGAFSLMVTLVWLYLEILRLLAKSRRR